MTTDSAFAGDDPHRLLSRIGELAHGVRRAQRATWYPLLVLAAVIFAAIPVERYGHYAATCRALPDARVCVAYSTAAFVYWPAALVLAYIAIAGFYLRTSRARGVGTRVRSYVIAGIALTVAVTCAALYAAHNPLAAEHDILGLDVAAAPAGLFPRLASPACAIGLALLVLARVERNRALIVFALGYLAIVLVPVTFGWVMTQPWFFLPHLVIDGTVLLLGSIGFALAQRPARRVAP